MHDKITCIQISLTTFCNMSCPECCYGMQIIPKEKKSFVTWEYLENAAYYFKGIETINLTGGEATIHPILKEWLPKLKELFDCKYLTLDTNGMKFNRNPEMYGYFDRIYVTRYHEGMFDGCPDNLDKIEFLQEYYKDRPNLIHINEITHIPRDKKGGNPCYRAYSGTLHYSEGRLFPCCTGAGLDTLVYISLTDNWRDDINKVYPPCNDCFFAV